MIELEYNPYKENIIIVGEAQTRKTTFAKKELIPLLMKANCNAILFDYHHNFTKEAHALSPQFVKSYISDLRGEGLEILQLEDNSPEMFENLIEKVCEMRNVVLLVDELHNFVTKYRAPDKLWYFLRNCNNDYLAYIAIFQRPAEVVSAVCSNSTHRFCFFLDLPTDIDYMKSYIGLSVERFAQEDIAEGEYCYKRRGKRLVQWGRI